MTSSADRFSRGSGVRVSDYNLDIYEPAEIKSIRERWAAFERGALVVVLAVIMGLAALLWIGDGVGTVGTLHLAAGIPVSWAIVIHIAISVCQSHLLSLSALIVRIFGVSPSKTTRRVIGGAWFAMTVVNMGSTTLAVWFMLHRGDHPYIGIFPALLGGVTALVMSSTERVFAFCWITLAWLRAQNEEEE